jgi:xylulokinase
MTYFLGLDIGTTNIKALLLDLDGRQVLSSTARTRMVEPRLGCWAEYDPEAIYEDVVWLICDLVQRVDRPEAIRALAISSMGETGVPVDARGKPVYPAIAWYDQRTAPQRQWWQEQVGAEAIYAITGLPVSASYGLLKLMWLRENRPEQFAHCRRWLPIGDYIAHHLCGVSSTDYTLAWRTMALDITRLSWSESLLTQAGLDISLMPPAVSSGTRLGPIRSEVSRKTGLSPDCVLVSGGMDAVCAMVAVGATEPGIVLDIIGTSEILLTTLTAPVLSPAGRNAALDVGPHAVAGNYLTFGSMAASGAIIEWFARLLDGADQAQGLAAILEQLTKEAEQEVRAMAPIVTLPHWRGSRTPYNDTNSRGGLVGLDLGTTRAQIFAGILAGLSFESQAVLASLVSCVGIQPQEIWVAGGATGNPLWMVLKSGVLEHDILIPDLTSVSAFGAAVLAAYGAGYYGSLGEATQRMKVEHRLLAHRCTPWSGYLACYASAYRALYASLQEVNRMVASYTMTAA